MSKSNLVTGAGFAIVIALMAMLGANAVSALRSVQQKLDQVVSINAEKQRQITIMRRANRERIISLQRMLLLEDPFDIDEERMRHMALANHFIQARLTLYEMASTDAEIVALDHIRERTMIAAPLNDRIRSLALAEEQDQARELMLEELVPAQNAIYEGFTSLAAIYESVATQANDVAQREYAAAQRRMALTLTLVVGACLLVAAHVIRATSRAERALRQHRDELEAQVHARTDELRKEVAVRELAERAAREEQERVSITLASIGDGVLTVSAKGQIEYLNPAAEIITGWSNDEARHSPTQTVLRVTELSSGRQCDLLKEDRGPLAAAARNTSEYQLERADGTTVEIESTVADISDQDGAINGAVVVLRDVSEPRALARELAFQATHDPLTGLCNRREFERQVKAALAESKSNGALHTLAYIDLDRFKVVNDTCGHATGDQLLCELSEKLKGMLRASDLLARLGGDEFGMLLRHCTIEHGTRLAESVREAVADYRLVHEGQGFSVGASIGAVEVSQDSEDLATVLNLADAACYLAKDGGRNRVHVYRTTDRDMVRHRGDMRWSVRLREALEQSKFELYCQPIVPLKANIDRSAQYEVLLRMRDEAGELVLPGAFLPAAERYGLLPDIDRHVMELVFGWLGQHSGAFAEGRLSVNVSGESISDAGFLGHVVETIETTGADPSRVIFEVTEHVAISNPAAAARFMSTLRKRGCEFALDDFGRGFSSLGNLKDLPVDYLKIDGDFVKDILKDTTDEATVRGINEIAHSLGKRTVAEFVEDQQIYARVDALGIDYAQGFGIARPQPIDDVLLTAARATVPHDTQESLQACS